MSTIRVIGLNDDNHCECFATPGSFYHNVNQLLAELAGPHLATYKIRHVLLIELEDKDITLGGVTKPIDEWFDLLATEYRPDKLFMEDETRWRLRELAFDYFWKIGEKE